MNSRWLAFVVGVAVDGELLAGRNRWRSFAIDGSTVRALRQLCRTNGLPLESADCGFIVSAGEGVHKRLAGTVRERRRFAMASWAWSDKSASQNELGASLPIPRETSIEPR